MAEKLSVASIRLQQWLHAALTVYRGQKKIARPSTGKPYGQDMDRTAALDPAERQRRYVLQCVENAPPMTAERRDRIAALFRCGATASTQALSTQAGIAHSLAATA
ncbi:hypothetical protein MINTM002_29060 [Mycobacterium intracellulare]|nr:hypothetical protein MINTM002_29060 [Mycobacterium intracellulare]